MDCQNKSSAVIPPCLLSLPQRARLGGAGKSLKLDAGSLDHLLQVDHQLGIHWIVGSSEGVQRCRAGGMEDPEHAQLLKALVDAPLFLLRGGRNHSGTQSRRGRHKRTPLKVKVVATARSTSRTWSGSERAVTLTRTRSLGHGH
jgi:hypothetical protein